MWTSIISNFFEKSTKLEATPQKLEIVKFLLLQQKQETEIKLLCSVYVGNPAYQNTKEEHCNTCKIACKRR